MYRRDVTLRYFIIINRRLFFFLKGEDDAQLFISCSQHFRTRGSWKTRDLIPTFIKIPLN